MEFRLLGPVEAWHDGAPVDLGDLQQRYVLVVLLLHRNRPVPNEVLTDAIWGDRRPSTNLTAGYIAKIRKTFREVDATDVALATTPTGYVLRVAPEQVDVDRFHQLCDEATRHSGNRARVELLREAIKLWRGKFLEDVDIDRVGGSDVPRPDEAYLDALGDLAELELAAGRHRWVRDQLRPVVRARPERPRLVALLMRALLANGDPVQAMEVYHRTRQILDEELGIPVPVEVRVLAGLAQYPNTHSTLPPRTARFVGRSEHLAIINTALRAAIDEPHVVWIHGEAGTGKSVLAVHAAYDLADAFPDGRLYLSLNGTDPADALARLLRDVGVPAERIPSSLADRTALYQAVLADTRSLVVLDNADAIDQVDLLIPRGSGCAAIVTSRQAGDTIATTSIPIGPLPAHEPSTGARFELYSDVHGKFRFRLRARNGEIIATGEAYETKEEAARRGADVVKSAAQPGGVARHRERADTTSIADLLAEALAVYQSTAQEEEPTEENTGLRDHQDMDLRFRTLSPQERKILELVALGMTNHRIAAELHVAEKTVEIYVSTMLRKLGVDRRIQAPPTRPNDCRACPAETG